MTKIKIRYAVSAGTFKEVELLVHKSMQIWDVKVQCVPILNMDAADEPLRPELMAVSRGQDMLQDWKSLKDLNINKNEVLSVTPICYSEEVDLIIYDFLSGETSDIKVQNLNTILAAKEKFCESFNSSTSTESVLSPRSVQWSFAGYILEDAMFVRDAGLFEGDTILSLHVERLGDAKEEVVLAVTPLTYTKEFPLIIRDINNNTNCEIKVQDSNTIWVAKKKYCEKLKKRFGPKVDLDLLQWSYFGESLDNATIIKDTDLLGMETIMTLALVRGGLHF